MCAYEHSLELMSIVLWHHKRSWVLMSAYGPMAPSSWQLLISHECLLLHGIKLMSVHRCSWVLMYHHKHFWAPVSTHKQLRAAMNTQEQPWVLMSSHKHSSAWCNGARSPHESSRVVMSGRTWGHGQSLRLMCTDGAIAPYSWMLTSAGERWYALISTHEGSLELMSANVLHWTINKNVNF